MKIRKDFNDLITEQLDDIQEKIKGDYLLGELDPVSSEVRFNGVSHLIKNIEYINDTYHLDIC